MYFLNLRKILNLNILEKFCLANLRSLNDFFTRPIKKNVLKVKYCTKMQHIFLLNFM